MSTETVRGIEYTCRNFPFAELIVRLTPPIAELHLDGEFIAAGMEPFVSWPLTDAEAEDLVTRGFADHVIV
jgi:hypothetical protein